ncbi:MAG: serine hydrolase domain-containing protein, partial [Polyangiaceae bacterium]
MTFGCAGSRNARTLQLPLFMPPRADAARRAKLEAIAPKVDAHFAAKFKEARATGLAVGILLDGELVYERFFGVRDLSSRMPVDGDTVFRIASITKSFTALAALKLRDEGRLAIDAPVATYAPELAALVPPTRDAAPVSLRLLLSNAAGLAYDDLWGAVTFGKNEDELAALLRNGVQFSTAPGSRYAYSNLGWALVGKVFERVSGARYRDYVTSNLLRPLGMNSTVWDASDVPAGRLAVGYYRDGDKLVEEPRPSDGVFAAAGGLYTSLHDYARYASLHLAAYPPRDDAESGPVRRSTLREMHEGQRWARMDKDAPVVRAGDDGLSLEAPSYGLGWLNVTSCTEEGRVQHGGMEPGYFAWVVLMPAARIGYVALATTEHVGRIARPGAFEILREAGLLTPPATRPHPVLAGLPVVFSRLLETRDADLFARTFDPDSLKYSWNHRLRDDLARIARERGRCSSDGKLDVHGAHHGSFRMKCERGAVRFEVLLSPATPPQVQSVNITEEL